MESIFILKLILSFIIGSVWVTLTTIAAEKYGSKIGGVIAGLPSTILVSLFFIGWTQSTQAVVEATTLVPLIGGVICLFLVAYLFLAPKINFWLSLLGATFIWFIFSLGVYFTSFRNFGLSFVIYLVLALVSFIIVERYLNISSIKNKKVKYTFSMIIFRGLIAGTIISIAVLLAKLSGPVLGGVFSMFPAGFISTILVIHFQHGKEFSFPIMKVTILSGISVVSFGLFARYTYVPLGLWYGTLVSLLLACIVGYLMHLIVKEKMK